MCGIVGLYERDAPQPDGLACLRTMRDSMVERGPDDCGEAVLAAGRVLLGHRRLSIIELSKLGHQPMVSPDGRHTIVFNGEIYNHLDLRPSLERAGWQFRSGSDTETILAAYKVHGPAAFSLLRGMFALAIWDEQRGSLVLARDPHGIKPLYYRSAPSFAFASQVRALLADPRTPREIDPHGLAGFAIWGSIPEPATLVASIAALPAGHWMEAKEGVPGPSRPFLRITDLYRGSPQGDPVDPRAALRDSVRAHMLADTEVGCFLSAGVDSGAILGMMRDCSPPALRAITLRFSEFAGTERDETQLAAKVAEVYGAQHRIETIDEADFRASQSQILDAMDQPSIDGVNTWFVSRAAARAGLKVALSGLGGDELLGGYSTFSTIPRTRRMLAFASHLGPIGAAARAFLRRFGRGKARDVLEFDASFATAYLLRRAMALPRDASLVLGAELMAKWPPDFDPAAAVRPFEGDDEESDLLRVGLAEASVYMRNQLLRDSDWAGMAHSLEIRLPLVDTVLTGQLAGLLPQFRNGRGKSVLASAPATPLPPAIVDRPKTGFGIPVAQWVGGGRDSRLANGWARRVLEAYIQRHRLSF